MQDDVRDVTGVADLREQRDVALALTVDDGDRLLVRVEAERREDEGQRDLLRASLDEHHRPCEEHLGTLGVELGDHPERLLPRQRLRLQERGAGPLVVAHEHELVELVDAEEDR